MTSLAYVAPVAAAPPTKDYILHVDDRSVAKGGGLRRGMVHVADALLLLVVITIGMPLAIILIGAPLVSLVRLILALAQHFVFG